MRSPLGPLKGTDFVHFYTLGYQARSANPQFYDGEQQYQTQIALVPESAPDRYIAVYPPHIALLFVPLSALPYGSAALVWAAINVFGYGVVVWIVWRAMGRAIPDAGFIAAAAAAFPPFWNLLLHGQTTLIPLIVFCGTWLALRRNAPALAGFVFGFVALKPQFGLVFGAVILLAQQWRVLVGLLFSLTLQALTVFLVFGTSVCREYVEMLVRLPQFAPLLEPKPYQMQSITAITRLLPYGGILFFGLSAFVVWRTLAVWNSTAPLTIRMSLVVVATVLVSPHLLIYDTTVLALPLLWVGSVVTSDTTLQEDRRLLGMKVYWLYITLLIPTAIFVGVQLSVVIVALIFWHVDGLANRLYCPHRGLLPARWNRPIESLTGP